MTRRVLSFAAAIGLLALLAGVPTLRAARAEGETAVPNVTVTPISGIVDGQTVAVTVTTSSNTQVYEAIARLCRGGVSYAVSTHDDPAPDFTSDGPNCPGPSHPVSTSSDATITDTLTASNASRPQGETFSFRIGSGVVNWNDTNANVARTLSCDDKNACSLVVELLYAPTPTTAEWKPFVFPIGYGVSDPIAGCGGPADDIVSAGGSDRMTEAWINWTVSACKQSGAKGAPTKLSFLGEGESVLEFNLGALDMAYTASGYDSKFGFVPPGDPALPNQGRRSAVAIPIAMNATVIGVGGGVRTADNHKSPFSSLKVTAAEAAALFAGGPIGVQQSAPDSTPDVPKTFEDDMKDRNAELHQAGLFDSAAGFPVGAYADGESFSWYGTNYMKTLAPDQWKVPNSEVFQDNKGKTRSVDADLAQADPSYVQAVTLVSNRSPLRKALIGPGPSTSGGVWVLTDLESATAMGLSPASVADANGNFVTPNNASILAALPGMTADEDGILTSTPTYTAAQTGGVAPYPMAFVEYALVPTEPLVDDDCSARTASEKLMTDWLSYITAPAGQADLPPGLVPLPESLKAGIPDQLKKVGAAAVTGTCAAEPTSAIPETPTTIPATDTTTPAASPSGSFDLSALGGFPTLPTSALNTFIPGVDDVISDAPTNATLQTAATKTPSVPAFAGAAAVGWIGTLFALVGIVALTSVAFITTSRVK